MKTVTIPVHDVSRRVLLQEYGPEPIAITNHDILFTHLTAHKLRERQLGGNSRLSATITLVVNDTLACHLQRKGTFVGATLFRIHREQMCRFVDAALFLPGKNNAKQALQLWLNRYSISEDEFPADSAYKIFQRWGWKQQEKNNDFLAQRRRISAEKMTKKKLRRATLAAPVNAARITMTQLRTELACQRFISEVNNLFRRPPAKLSKQIRIYYYRTLLGLSVYETGRKLGVPASSVSYACRAIEAKCKRNLTLRRLLDNCALQRVAA